MLSVTQYDRADISHSETVDKHLSCRHLTYYLHFNTVGFNHLTDIQKEYIFLGYAHLYCKTLVLFHMLVFAVYRYKEFRLCQCKHHFKLVLAGVTRNVYLVHSLVYYLCTLLHKLVYELSDKLLVAGYRSSRNNDKIARCYRYLSVISR